jgi:hypothetical protein
VADGYGFVPTEMMASNLVTTTQSSP